MYVSFKPVFSNVGTPQLRYQGRGAVIRSRKIGKTDLLEFGGGGVYPKVQELERTMYILKDI